ncbi:MAG: 1,4-dihydroxy-2-naphthoate octaprenyltransferase [Muribaculaceae bacterium]
MNSWIVAMRPRTLPVSVAGVLTAIGLSAFNGVFKPIPALLCFLFALLAQIVSNFANEYYDFKRGTDKIGRVGPRRGVTEGDITPNAMRNVTFATLAVTGIIGCGLIPFGGWWLLPIGLAIAVFALAYSTGPYPLSYHGLGDIAVLIFFGIVPVNLTFYVQSGYFDINVFLASISIGLLSMNVLLVNNYRDMEDDATADKHTTVVIFGRKKAVIAYIFSGYIAMALLSWFWLTLPLWIFACPAIYLALHTFTWNQLTTRTGSELNSILGATARNMLIFALLFVGSLLIEKYL